MTSRTQPWTADQIPSQVGHRVLITGANSGIGFETALELARKGAEIVLPARSQQKADEAAARIRADVPSASVIPAVMDLASQHSVADFAAWFSQRFPGPSLDLLISNAGVMAVPKRELTVDGWERQFATNFLGPFALIARLYGHVRQQHGSRIVIVSSSITKWARLEFDNLQSERKYVPWDAYNASKLANLLFALELDRRARAAKSRLVSIPVHPGVSTTSIFSNGPGAADLKARVVKLLAPILFQDDVAGAWPTLYAATVPEARGGEYIGPGGFKGFKGYPKVEEPRPQAKDVESARRLWTVSEELTGVVYPALG
ncbi:MAG TPA: oxidoreductase, partial [Terriglobus sp.]